MKLPLMIQVALLDLTERSSAGQWFHLNQLSGLHFVYITYRMQCCGTHTHTHTHTYTHTHTRTHTHRIRKAENLFVRASSSELWARHLCRRFQSEIVRAKAFPRYRHLPNLSVCDSRRSPTSASLLSLFRGNDVKAFKTAAIEEDAGTKTASDGALSDRILRKWLARRWTSHLCRV